MSEEQGQQPTRLVLEGLKQQPMSAFSWEQIARYLFGLLDDIDTVSDLVRNDDRAYRLNVTAIQHKRFKVGVTDGYTLVFRPKEDHV